MTAERFGLATGDFASCREACLSIALGAAAGDLRGDDDEDKRQNHDHRD